MDFLASIRRDSDRFYEVAASADPDRAVPSCPDWTIADLTWHLAEVHWFWATDVELRASGPDEIEGGAPPRPVTHEEVIAFGRSQVDRMIGLLRATADDVAVWTWALDEVAHNVGFVRRHQVQEAAVHRWDMENAGTGDASAIDAAVAADSIDEVLAISLPWGANPDKPLPGTVHLHCTDTEGEWFVHTDGRVEPIHQKGDVAIRGSASDILLGLYTRVPLNDLDVIGDSSLAAEFVSRISSD